ncbi:hypothetical protein CRG98_005607 [Punica granatum]|uniref:BAH domain-containing protein n=1 Tax=Punica granatum TaxID=22663 RepID=A0A2I0L082_PUNGR|nr:hypothetical protein CRG98_005607 [Punica granatum]
MAEVDEEKGHYLGYLEDMYEDKKGLKKVRVRWFHLTQEIVHMFPQFHPCPREVFITPHVQVISAEYVEGPATVLTPAHYKNFLATPLQRAPPEILTCCRRLENNKIRPFSLSWLHGYCDQEVVSLLDPTLGSRSKFRGGNGNSDDGDELSHIDGVLSNGPRVQVWKKSLNKIKVRYEDVMGVDDFVVLEEWVPASRVANPDKLGMRCSGRKTIRPSPPKGVTGDCTFEIGSPVDAWWCNGRWEGVVIGRISVPDKVQVYLPVIPFLTSISYTRSILLGIEKQKLGINYHGAAIPFLTSISYTRSILLGIEKQKLGINYHGAAIPFLTSISYTRSILLGIEKQKLGINYHGAAIPFLTSISYTRSILLGIEKQKLGINYHGAAIPFLTSISYTRSILLGIEKQKLGINYHGAAIPFLTSISYTRSILLGIEKQKLGINYHGAAIPFLTSISYTRSILLGIEKQKLGINYHGAAIPFLTSISYTRSILLGIEKQKLGINYHGAAIPFLTSISYTRSILLGIEKQKLGINYHGAAIPFLTSISYTRSILLGIEKQKLGINYHGAAIPFLTSISYTRSILLGSI